MVRVSMHCAGSIKKATETGFDLGLGRMGRIWTETCIRGVVHHKTLEAAGNQLEQNPREKPQECWDQAHTAHRELTEY